MFGLPAHDPVRELDTTCIELELKGLGFEDVAAGQACIGQIEQGDVVANAAEDVAVRDAVVALIPEQLR